MATITRNTIEINGKHSLTKRQLLMEDRMTSIPLPDDTFDYRKTASTFAGSKSLVRYDTNDYSVPVSSAHHSVTVKASVSFIEVYHQDRPIIPARGPACKRLPVAQLVSRPVGQAQRVSPYPRRMGLPTGGVLGRESRRRQSPPPHNPPPHGPRPTAPAPRLDPLTS